MLSPLAFVSRPCAANPVVLRCYPPQVGGITRQEDMKMVEAHLDRRLAG